MRGRKNLWKINRIDINTLNLIKYIIMKLQIKNPKLFDSDSEYEITSIERSEYKSCIVELNYF